MQVTRAIVAIGAAVLLLAATPLSAEYTIDHLHLAPSLRDNLTFGYYEGGHMMYVHEPSLEQLKQDLDSFYESAMTRE